MVQPAMLFWFGGLQATVTVLGGVVWVTVAVPLLPVFVSEAETSQVPLVVDEVYVTVALPFPSVLADADFSVPHAPVGLALPVLKATLSPATGAPAELVTVAVTVEVLLPSAGMLAGDAATATLFFGAV
jgi:hypothetical protein